MNVSSMGRAASSDHERSVRVLFQSTGGDDPVLFQLLRHLRISGGRFLEMDIEVRSLRDNILIDIGFLFPFVVLLRVADSGSRQPHIS